ncbi:30S ribosomal protein S17 [Patescibacteria group bacterium]|nr:30S ribosomal protein S17 [Patescibacteria group bacterium]
MEKTTIQNKRRLDGKVVSTSMQNTAVVRVDRVNVHPRYKKRYTTSKKYACECKGIGLKVGDNATIEETRPISKTKRWRIVENI